MQHGFIEGGARGWPRKRKLPTRAGALEYAVAGHGQPVLVLLSGAGIALEGWRPLFPAIECLGTVFTWNRFGIAGSDRPRLAQTGALVVSSLRELLAYAGLEPPYLLVGHSLGGLYANLFARLHPREVAGAVLIEAAHPQDRQALREEEGRLAATLARLFEVPQRLFRGNLHAEIARVAATAREVESAGPFPQVPLAVVTGGRAPPSWLVSPAALRLRREHQRQLAGMSAQGEHVIAARSGHFPQLTQPRLVLDVIGEIAARAGLRRPLPWP